MTHTPPLMCVCEKPTNNKLSLSHCGRCRLPIYPTAEHEKDLPLKPLPDTHPLRSKLPDTNPTAEPKCCEKCIGTYQCLDVSCPCHTKKCEYCEAGVKHEEGSTYPCTATNVSQNTVLTSADSTKQAGTLDSVVEGEWGLDPANCKAGDKHAGIFNAITHAQMATTKEEMQTSRIEVFQEIKSLITTLLHTERESAMLRQRNYDQTLIEKARAEERERIVKICEEKMEQKYHCKEYYSALSEIRDNLTNNV